MKEVDKRGGGGGIRGGETKVISNESQVESVRARFTCEETFHSNEVEALQIQSRYRRTHTQVRRTPTQPIQTLQKLAHPPFSHGDCGSSE